MNIILPILIAISSVAWPKSATAKPLIGELDIPGAQEGAVCTFSLAKDGTLIYQEGWMNIAGQNLQLESESGEWPAEKGITTTSIYTAGKARISISLKIEDSVEVATFYTGTITAVLGKRRQSARIKGSCSD